jgi:hypothetical protein
VDRDFFKGDDLHAAYDTRQVFMENSEAAAFTALSPLYFTPPPVRHSLWGRLRSLVGPKGAPATQPLPPKPKPKHPAIQWLMRFPPDVRIREYGRLQRLGAI